MTRRSLLAAAAAVLSLPLPAFASTGTVTAIRRVPAASGATMDIPTFTGSIAPDGGGAAVSFTQINGGNPDLSKIKAGTRVEYQGAKVEAWGTHLRTDITRILDGAQPAPAPRPAPSAAAAQPTGTVKTYDAATRRGTVAPSAGGPDLFFAVDPSAKGDIRVGSRITYVQVVATGLAP